MTNSETQAKVRDEVRHMLTLDGLDTFLNQAQKEELESWYVAGSKSPARIEAVVKRAVELARQDVFGEPPRTVRKRNPDEILAQILDEQKEPTE